MLIQLIDERRDLRNISDVLGKRRYEVILEPDKQEVTAKEERIARRCAEVETPMLVCEID